MIRSADSSSAKVRVAMRSTYQRIARYRANGTGKTIASLRLPKDFPSIWAEKPKMNPPSSADHQDFATKRQSRNAAHPASAGHSRQSRLKVGTMPIVAV